MDQSQQRFLDALKAAIHNTHVLWQEDIPLPDWLSLFRLAEQHHVLPMIYEAVYSCPAAQRMEPGVFQPYRQKTMHQVTKQLMQTDQFLQLYRHLQAAGIQPLVVKGLICRNLYPNPDYRLSGDEDVWIPRDQFPQCHEALISFGMCLADPGKDIDKVYEVPYGKPESPLYIELHKSLFPPESDAYGDWNRFFEGVFDRAVAETIQGTTVYTMDHTDHLFYLICHAFKHFLHSGFGIRQVCDIVMFAHTYGENLDWPRIVSLCREIHADVFTAALFRIGENALGLPVTETGCPQEWRQMEIDESALLDDLLCSGIYGGADMSRKHSSNITLNAVAAQKKGRREKHAVLKTLFPSASALSGRYPYLKKYPFLLPLAWGERIWKYRRENGAAVGNQAADSIKLGNQRVELLKQYHIIE